MSTIKENEDEGLAVCLACKVSKSQYSEYYWPKNKRMKNCKECHKAYMKEWMTRYRKRLQLDNHAV